MLAIIALISGVFTFFAYKQNMRGRETANFDFIPQTEVMEYKSFWKRLKDNMVHFLYDNILRCYTSTETAIRISDQENEVFTFPSDNSIIRIRGSISPTNTT